ncbi:beta-1,4-galactosyltransferase 6-like [Patiria miniata]|uniref:Beta-1,4-galactosyltransferase n=1 Tax=Patiria miniata TaxID=46514 RepID=A0A913ZTK9_PATMI|nr:beta-1,4-galactosyltransferase 6-like [Patiria miniata]
MDGRPIPLVWHAGPELTSTARRSQSPSAWSVGPLGHWSPKTIFTVVTAFVVATTTFAFYFVNDSVAVDFSTTVVWAFNYRNVSAPALDKPLAAINLPRAKTTTSGNDTGGYCPPLKNISNLNKSNVLHLEETSMDTTESLVFGDMKDKILHLVEGGNRHLRAPSLQTTSTSSYDGLLDSLIPLGATVGNYSYLPGGHWRPRHCTPRWKVAIIIPYRHREYHLPILLRHLVPMLKRQLLQFAIYVVNQENDLPFNRATLMNVGFLESLNFSKWDCFVLHDVDHVPLSDLNNYGCTNMPKRMLSGSDRWNNKIPYRTFFGAVTGMTRENIRTINGFPNVYWGWGGEDDEIWRRVRAHHIRIIKTKGPTHFYKVIAHHHDSAPKNKDRKKLLRTFKSRFNHDGLNNIKYARLRIELHALYTNISVDIQKL